MIDILQSIQGRCQDQDEVFIEILKKNEMSEENKKKFERSTKSLIFFLKQFDYNPFNSEIEFCVFGSQLNGFGTKESDVDFTFITNSYVDERIALKYLQQETNSVDQNKFKIKEFVEFARIAVMKIEDSNNKIEIDICFNNLLGVINTKLLYAYANLNKKVQQGGVLLKLWGKKQGIINKSCFSSYAILIMWLHFLQEKYQMPNLQNKQYKPSNQKTMLSIKRNIEGRRVSSFDVDVFFVYNGQKYNQLKDQFDKSMSQVSLKQLLKDYFTYYQDQGEGFNQKYKISINEKQLKEEGEKYSMCDPFDKEHDPIKKIRNNFKDQQVFNRAAKSIEQNAQIMF
ncbi:unnamed protein product [Paramecium sonneborni]|uniref:Poly(A) RNA polymerase mitochondrial-like central palm domain-containing protein n=1 Tax=Paramecium sonneborni TaxID=65129 RepID=A0A8S1PT07_9CILI|nr:unnamed protein product [Paramecium sonneborni]